MTKQNDSIDVHIADLTFTFDYSDKHLGQTFKKADQVTHAVRKIVNQYQTGKISQPQLVEEVNEELESTYDLILGEGAYKQIYEVFPSIISLCIEYPRMMEQIKQKVETKKIRELKRKERLMKKARRRRS